MLAVGELARGGCSSDSSAYSSDGGPHTGRVRGAEYGLS